ncbi:MAG: alanine--tRNA ligase [Candidatus Omnitrophica bacterium]|nr:alanine--tRNA ligase [Candidatus Omnitrophota bacterium]
MTTNEIRKLFLDFFKSKGHTIVPSDSLVPKDDPTVLFTGAGMNQFKEKFLGRNVTYKRAATCQKCLRTGDLDNVGKTSGHHTFFEMLGNFSFGDYFKKEAILWAWEFFTGNLKIDPVRLWASVYKDDEEAYGIWKDTVKIPGERILKLGEKDNFWPSEAPTKGPNGPCGPCSEIFYDYGKDVGCGKPGCTPACDCGRFVEVWNMVFTQYDRHPDDKLKPLPANNIDTGMGLERLASVMQGVKTNFEIDIFVPIISEIEKFSKTKGRASKAKANAIADHIRAVTFMIADGVMPSNEERGYVARKLIRRAASHGRDIGILRPFLYKLVTSVTDVMRSQYPEIIEKRDDIAQIVKKEEESFLFVIDNQLPKVEEAFEKMKARKDAGEIAEGAFNFYDTYGMPYEMLEEAAERHGLKIDEELFESFLERQRKLSRAKTKMKSEIFSETFAKKVEALDLRTEFLGYDKAHAKAKVLAVLGDGEVILDKTPFYGESGGQAGDWGKIETESGAMEVEDAKKIGQTIVHIGKMLRGTILKGEDARVFIDEATRRKVMANHTATHLLQAALRKVLGDHVRQTGSMVDSGHLRFDFTHMKKMDQREISRVEEIINGNIKDRIKVEKTIKSLEEARSEGATALFGEKYEDKVRVVTIGDVSKELCGGTHADNTNDIRVFKLISESSIASGVRRIEALTGEAALEWARKAEKCESLRLAAESAKEETKKAMQIRTKEELLKIDSIIARSKAVGASKIVAEMVENVDIECLRVLSDGMRTRERSIVMVLGTVIADKASFIVSVTDDLVDKGLNAGAIAKDIARLIEGSGGGKSGFAQGGGRSPDKLKASLNKISEDLGGRI